MDRQQKCHSADIREMLRIIPVAPTMIRKCQVQKHLGCKNVELLLAALPSWIPLGSDEGQLCYISASAKKEVMHAYGIDG